MMVGKYVQIKYYNEHGDIFEIAGLIMDKILGEYWTNGTRLAVNYYLLDDGSGVITKIKCDNITNMVIVDSKYL